MFIFTNIDNKKQKAANLLEVDVNSSESEIKKAYRKASLKWHPDKNNNDEFATEMFKKITEGYNTLLNKTEEIPNIFNNFTTPFTEDEQINIEAEDFFNFLNDISLQESMGINVNKPMERKEIKKENLKYRVRIKISDIWLNSVKKLKIKNKFLNLPLYYDNIIFKGNNNTEYSYIAVEIIDKEDIIDNIVYKRKGKYDIEIIKQIELYKLYNNHIIDIKLPDNSVEKVEWKKDYINNIKDEKIKGFFLYNLGLPKPNKTRGKLWVIFSIILPETIQETEIKINKEIKDKDLLIPEWFDFKDIYNNKYKDRNINLNLDDFI